MARLPKSGVLELPVTINTILEVVFSNILQLNDVRIQIINDYRSLLVSG